MRKKASPADVHHTDNTLQVESIPIDDIKEYAGNARQHTVEQIELIAKSITEFGWTNPCIIDANNELIAGHARYSSARLLNMTAIPCIRLGHLTPVQKRALVIADNKIAITGSQWDYTLLKLELAELKLADFDLGLCGFDAADLADLFGRTPGETDPDDVPDAPVNPVTVLGDVWLMGRHRLVCGDSTITEAVDAALAGVRPHLMVTDPPYGVSYDATWRDDTGLTRSKQVAVGKVTNDTRANWVEAWALFPGSVAYVWHGGLHGAEVSDGLVEAGLEIRAQIIWVKQGFVFGRGHYHWQHEPCFYAVRKGVSGAWTGDRKQTTVWQIENANKMKGGKADDMTTGHSTQKPVECMKRPIENNSSPGQAVYEPFSGSGTTIIAAEMTGRSCHAIELSPVYTDVSVQRWQAFTGQQATLDADGRTFAEITADRAKAAA